MVAGLIRLFICLMTASTAVLAIWLQLALPANAQQSGTAGQGQNPQTQETVKALPPVYNEQMMRLAEVLGSIHYLRQLCGAEEGQLWRDKMAELIESEKPTAERQALMIARFNRGFRSFSEIYAGCTPSAIAAAERYRKEGTRLANEITTRYGR